MDKRKLLVSIIAGILAFVMIFGLVASFIPTKAHAARSSELKAQLDALKAMLQNYPEATEDWNIDPLR